MSVRLLGPLTVVRLDGTVLAPQHLRTGKTADLLRLLALRAGLLVPADELVAEFWPEALPARGRASLRTAASQIRVVLDGSCLVRTTEGLALDAWVDATEFRKSATAVRGLVLAQEWTLAADAATHALALYRDDLRASQDDADWVVRERDGLRATLLGLLTDAAEAELGLGRAAHGVALTERAVELDPFAERSRRLLLQAHMANGEIAVALREYERYRRLLADELGVDPSATMRALHEKLVGADAAAPPTSAAVTPVGVVRPARALRSVPGLRSAPEQGSFPEQRSVPEQLSAPEQRSVPEQRSMAAPDLWGSMGAVVRAATRPREMLRALGAPVLQGRAAAVQPQLDLAAEVVARDGDSGVRERFEMISLLACHDLASADSHERWHDAVTRHGDDPLWSWLLLRIATERGEWELAARLARVPAPQVCGLIPHLHTLARASALAMTGARREAAAALHGAVDDGHVLRSALLLPELVAGLVMVDAAGDVDPSDAVPTLDQLPDIASAPPREQVLRRLAGAHVLAVAGSHSAAVVAAAAAAHLAEAAELPWLATNAFSRCALHVEHAQAARVHRFEGSLGAQASALVTLRAGAVVA